MSELNLFGDPQERPRPPEFVKARFTIDDDVFGWEVSGVCLLKPEQVESENPVEVKVVEWIDELPWEWPEFADQDRTVFYLCPAYECEVMADA